MTNVQLPDPDDDAKTLEDYVSSLFRCAGYFVETNIVDRAQSEAGTKEVLELDSIATSYPDTGASESIIAEVKSGGWGFPDIFKVAGWNQYLGIKRGAFFVSKCDMQNLPTYQERAKRVGVAVVHLADFERPQAVFEAAGFGKVTHLELLRLWRWAAWIEREILARLSAAKKDAKNVTPEMSGPAEVVGYHKVLNDEIFFTRDVRMRVRKLYNAYKEHPKLSKAVAHEINTREWKSSSEIPEKCRVFDDSLYKGTHFPVQAAFYTEHRGRLAVLKAAIDYLLLRDAGAFKGDEEKGISDPFGEGIVESLFQSVPQSFHEGLNELQKGKTWRRYALLWQNFLWLFGGFYLEDRKTDEFALLGEVSDVPVSEVEAALGACGSFFNITLSKFGPDSKTVGVKMFPHVFRGLGAFLRLKQYQKKNYDEFCYSWPTRDDLIGWHNSMVHFLVKK